MPKRVVVDSGPLIALFDRDDRYHEKATRFLKAFRGQLLSNIAVITEVTHLLDFSIKAQTDFIRWIANGAVTLVDVTNHDLYRIVELTEKYADLPMDFADASLVVICERLKIREVASIDKDFLVYRTSNKNPLRNVFF
jgi:predicted nucleic acid-binding protein